MKELDFARLEKKWQQAWERKKVFQVQEQSRKKKWYVLEMFPYPSGSGLHMGHAFNYVVGDIYARFKRMQGFNVLYPMGYDSLGLPAENAAIKEKTNPKKYTENSIKNFISQQKSLGLSYDWSRVFWTHNPEYYKWDQWIFLKMFEKGLAFRKKAPVNWCPKCKTVLANEQVHDGKCWRHEDTQVEIKHLEQWFFKITKYANELYEKIKTLEHWPEDVKAMQENWIGKSHGLDIDFKIDGEKWKIFTTRPDTIYGVTFMVISAQHPQLMRLVNKEQKAEVEKFLKKIKSTSEKDLEELEKEGVFTGSYALNPFTNEKVPVYVGNFVVADYGSGMVMAVPAHDQRDYEFARKYSLPIKEVIKSEKGNSNLKERAFTEPGILVNSGKFNGMNSKKAISEISKYVENKNLGKRTIQFRLKDWLISRQRYWGTPIPIVYCDKCGIVPIPENQLPVKLPEKVKFGKGNPLVNAKSWQETKCPKCNGKARRETDTMDTFVNSSWYFLRYADAKNKKEIFNKNRAGYWMPVDTYIGGKEHACMHLIYFRFYTKFLADLGLLKVREPAVRLFNQGMVCGPDGSVMSKSRGNVVNPMDMIKKQGADILRLYLVSTAGPDKDFIWSDKTVQGSLRFVNHVFSYFSNIKGKIRKSGARLESKVNKTIKQISSDIENFKYNMAVIKLRELFDYIEGKEISKKDAESFLKLFSVFCPHIAEELWHKLGNKSFISLESWPKAQESKINKKFEEEDKAQSKLIEDINNILRILENRQERRDNVFVYTMPKEKEMYNESMISEKIGKKVQIFSVSDKIKYDPTNKSKNSKPGKPAIYLE